MEKPTPDVSNSEYLDPVCIQCGYILRGLSGDPIRCPECGEYNQVTEPPISRGELLGVSRELETGPTVCVGATWVVGLGCVFVWFGWLWAAVLLLVGTSLIWGLAVIWFRA